LNGISKGISVTKIVLDTSAILTGLEIGSDNEYYTTPEVVNEIHSANVKLKVEFSIKDGDLKLIQPQKRFSESANEKVEFLGEIDSVSDTDKSILALALEIREQGNNVLIATDDYSIQNVAKSLSLPYSSIKEVGIKKALAWHYVCIGCGQQYKKNIIHCESCGNKVKRRAKRS
jgi:UPF0271 protein